MLVYWLFMITDGWSHFAIFFIVLNRLVWFLLAFFLTLPSGLGTAALKSVKSSNTVQTVNFVMLIAGRLPKPYPGV